MVKSNDNKVESIKTLAGIDTLYYFVDTFDSELYHKFFNMIIQDNLAIVNDDIDYLCYATRTNGVIGPKYALKYNDIHIASVTFKDPDKQTFMSNIYVQLMGSGIYGLGLKKTIDLVSDYLNSLFGYEPDYNRMYPSRVDVNCFVNGFDFSNVSADCFGGFFRSSRKKEVEEFKKGQYVETLYLGSRSGSFYFKIYNKKRELEVKQKELSTHIKREYLSQNGFNLDDELWNLEFTIKIEKLKEFNIFNLTYLFDFYKLLYLKCFQDLSFYGFIPAKVKHYKKTRNLSKLSLHPVWNLVNDNIDKQTLLNDIDIEWKDNYKIKDVVKNGVESQKEWRKNNLLYALRLCNELDIKIDDILENERLKNENY